MQKFATLAFAFFFLQSLQHFASEPTLNLQDFLATVDCNMKCCKNTLLRAKVIFKSPKFRYGGAFYWKVEGVVTAVLRTIWKSLDHLYSNINFNLSNSSQLQKNHLSWGTHTFPIGFYYMFINSWVGTRKKYLQWVIKKTANKGFAPKGELVRLCS